MELTTGDTSVYFDTSSKYHIVVYEIIYEFQYWEYLAFKPFFQSMVSKMKAHSIKNIYIILYPDVPYFGLFHMLAGINPTSNIFRNYFEFEAVRFTQTK